MTTPEDVAATAGLPTQPVSLDLDDDGVPEPHTLLLSPLDGQILVHTDPKTLQHYLEKYRRKLKSPSDQQILTQIKQEAKKVHTRRYGTRCIDDLGYTKVKAPTVQEQAEIQTILLFIATMMASLTRSKSRPASHLETLVIHNIGGDQFCEKVVMEPLTLMPRDDGIVGSPPVEETNLWRRLTEIAGYKRGHMLNAYLHGPGVNINLVPISTAFNAVMREGVEKETKTEVNSRNRVVRFEAEALDWGLFSGAFGFPDEQALPARFHFKVERLLKTPGTTGADRTHWRVGPIVYDQTLAHDIPTDVVAGVVRPVARDFVPGLYFHPLGTMKKVAPGRFHLEGLFNANLNRDQIGALGIDDPANLTLTRINEPVLSVYNVPPGYGIKSLPPTVVEYVWLGKVMQYTTPEPAFIIFNLAEEARLKQEHAGQVAAARKQELKAKVELDKKAAELDKKAAEKKEQEKERDQEQEKENLRKQLRRQENDNFRHQLLRRIRDEMPQDLAEFGEDFRHKREGVLSLANGKWKNDDDLSEKTTDALLNPVRERLRRVVAELRAEREEEQEEQRNFVKTLTDRFDAAVLQQRDTFKTKDGLANFIKDAGALFTRHEEYWQRCSLAKIREHGVEKYWQEAEAMLNSFYKKAAARERPVEHQNPTKKRYPH